MAQIPRWILIVLLALWSVGFILHPLDGERVAASFLHLIHLPFHEAGHVLFSPFGSFMTSLGGSLMQVAVPLVCAGSFLSREDRFAACVCVWWAGQSLIDIAPYIADARALRLVLLGGFTGAEVEGHDWEAILSTLGWLHHDRAIAYVAHVMGSAGMIASLAAAAWITLQATGTRHPASTPR